MTVRTLQTCLQSLRKRLVRSPKVAIVTTVEILRHPLSGERRAMVGCGEPDGNHTAKDACYMTATQHDSWANPWVTGMPDALAEVVIRYDRATRRTIIENWGSLGARGQERYRRHVENTPLSWI